MVYTVLSQQNRPIFLAEKNTLTYVNIVEIINILLEKVTEFLFIATKLLLFVVCL